MKFTHLFIRTLLISFYLFLINTSCCPIPIEVQEDSFPLPVLAALPNIPDVTYFVTDFGANPNDGIDDTNAIQKAINSVSGKGGGRIVFPDGVYNVSIQGNGSMGPNYALQIISKIALEAENSRKAILMLGNNQPNYASILYWKSSGNADDVRIKGLVINANSTNNQPVSYDDFKYIEGDKIIRWLPRMVLSSRNGKRVEIDDVHFTNLLNINTINIGVNSGSTGEQVSDITISNCLFDNIGWQKYDFDHSTIYTQGNRFVIKNNILKSVYGAGTLSARCAIEIHGSDQTIINNEIIGFTIGNNVTGTFILSQRQLIENNSFLDVARGVYLWSYKHDSWPNATMLSDVVINKNYIRISPDAWLASSVPSRKHLAGITTNPTNSSPIENLFIENNTIVTSGYKNAINVYKTATIDCGIAFNNTDLRNVHITNNTIGRNLGPGIGGNGNIDDLFIDKNKLLEPEMATLSELQIRAAINLTGMIRKYTITNNEIKDIEIPTNIKYGIFINNADGNYNVYGNTVEPSTIPLLYDMSATVNNIKESEYRMKIEIKDKLVVVNNVNNGEILYLIDMSGHLCASQQAYNSQAKFYLDNVGIYIIRNIATSQCIKTFIN